MFSSSKIYSHSNRNLLSEHLFYTAKVMHERTMIDKELAFILGICHDFGKLTSFFQEEKIRQSGKKYKQKSNHSLISIYFTLAFLKHTGSFDEASLLVAFFAVNHHSDLRNLEEIRSIAMRRDHEEIKPQIEDLKARIALIESVYKTELVSLMQEHQLLESVQNAIFSFDFAAFLNVSTSKMRREILSTLQKTYDAFDTTVKYELYFKTSYLYSLLIFADRNMAAKLPYAYHELHDKNVVPPIPTNLFERQVRGFGTDAEDIRQIFFEQLDSGVEAHHAHNIFTVTAPTGSGKTLTTLNFALKLKTKTQKEKIIYALPLTNIIEQNYGIIKDVLNTFIGELFTENEYCYLIKHHYLADYQLDEQNDLKNVLKRVESWDSEIVVTTFIQLFYAFGNNRASYLYRFSALQNSVLIFDEPQVLNAEHWLLIRKMLFWLINHLNVKIILMTATKPLIFFEDEYLELTKGIDFTSHIRKRKSRHKLVPMFEPEMTVKAFAGFVRKEITCKKSALVVLNTKQSSIDFFNEIKNTEDSLIFYLSTTLTPYHRKEVIERIQYQIKHSDKKIIVVSTQVIEAGVDLDFEIGFRDLAPLDSIIQTAGRINRHFLRKNTEILYIVQIQKEVGTFFGDFVYNTEFLKCSKAILNEVIEEADFEKKIEDYFVKIQRYVAPLASKIEEGVASLNFQNMAKSFQIIEKSNHTVPLFLEINDEAIKSLQNFHIKQQEIDLEPNYEKRYQLRKELSYLQKRLYQFIVNINAANKATDDWLTIINSYDIDTCYIFNDKTKIGIGIDEERMGIFS